MTNQFFNQFPTKLKDNLTIIFQFTKISKTLLQKKKNPFNKLKNYKSYQQKRKIKLFTEQHDQTHALLQR